jgi:hypothetical protein
MNEYNLPDTLQGCMDFIKFGEADVKRLRNKANNLDKAIEAARARAIMLTPAKKEVVNAEEVTGAEHSSAGDKSGTGEHSQEHS